MTSRIETTFQTARNTVKATASGDKVQWKTRGRLENYLTEIIALACLDDWRPFEKVLRDHDLVRAHERIVRIRPYTCERA